MFPPGYFYIISRKNGYALDVYDGQTKTGANIIIWPQKFADSDNQLWSFDGGRIVNKKSGHVLDIQSGAFKKDKTIVQNKRKEKNQSQEWGYEHGYIHSVVYPTMILEIKSEDGGAQVLLERKDENNLNQQWYLEPHQIFETSLGMAANKGPLHKQAGFGQPRLGYGGEVGVPPELKSLPKNIQVVGVNGYTPSGPTNPPTNPSNHTSVPPSSSAAAPGYGYASAAPAHQTTGPTAQPVYQSQASLATGNNGYNAPSYSTPPQHHHPAASSPQQPSYPPHGNHYSTPSQPHGGAHPAYTTPNHPPHGSGYPPQPPNPNVYPPTSNAAAGGGYPSPTQHQYQTSNVYPPPHPQQPHHGSGAYPPPQPPVSTGVGYPPVSSPSFGSYPPQPQQPAYPPQPAQQMPSAAPGGFYPPPLPERQPPAMPMPGTSAGYPPTSSPVAPAYPPPYPPN
ncbi:hypothetical protein O0I10_007151 [Lichtheimia ornata]|uniref:Ricin B lectin domain-containing protein n=1 Tax=Lichtheimia ornata TaxID=688661 RepID=A0AAD7V3L7_9FUNG|nr:uncharacterized protein O0I10_007151 [Lichtheimia ornata]KAJ8657071.1 hypothetical protein O0I10_007151 [Lichtheimia ornata]